MAREELGTKRVCPETGRKFYDLNKDPIVSPYSGASYPLSFFEGEKEKLTKPEDEKVAKTEAKAAEPASDDETDDDDGAELVSLEEADAEIGGDIPDLEEEDDDVSVAADDDTFLEDEDDEDEDVIGIPVDVDEDDD